MSEADRIAAWLNSLERRHLADLTLSEVARALRALSSCYVERRSRLAAGEALASRGKRAAFALFYGPMHFFVVREIVAAIPGGTEPLAEIVDLGCGTGTAGASWALAARVPIVRGYDRHRWALEEAAATYRELGLAGRTAHRDVGHPSRAALRVNARTGVIAAYVANELSPEGRSVLLAELLDMAKAGARVLIVEPIARRANPWWTEWQTAFERAGGRADEWRFPVTLPETQLRLARAAGLNPRELTARTLVLGMPR
jgi:hypothetical protein